MQVYLMNVYSNTKITLTVLYCVQYIKYKKYKNIQKLYKSAENKKINFYELIIIY